MPPTKENIKARDWEAVLAPYPNRCVERLDLSYERIGPEGAATLASALQNNDTVGSLNLWQNDIGTEGAVAMAKALESNSTLRWLNMCHNKIDNKGAVSLGKALERNNTVTTMDLRGNHIDSEGAAALARALESNSTVTVLSLPYYDISHEVEQLVDCLVRANRTLREATPVLSVVEQLMPTDTTGLVCEFLFGPVVFRKWLKGRKRTGGSTEEPPAKRRRLQ